MGSPHDWVSAFLERAAGGLDLNRVVEDSPGVDADRFTKILQDDRLGQHAMEAMTDLFHPTDSMYYDAIFGAFHGQRAIRNWLVPAMRDISFIEFKTTAPTEIFERDGGTSSIDEWQMWINLGEESIPFPRGVSTRHSSDGWARWNADVYDSSPMRQPPPNPEDAQPMPDPPRIQWTTEPIVAPPMSDALQAWLDRPATDRGPLDHADINTVMLTHALRRDPSIMGSLFHAADSELFEPTAHHVGAEAIRQHLDDAHARSGDLTFERVGPALFNGSCTAFEWVARPIGDASPGLRGTSVYRYRDGFIVYGAVYYDTAITSS